MALLIAAVTALALDVGIGGTMIFVRFVLMFSPTEVAFWLVMQLGLILDFLTTYPAMLCLADTAGHQGGRVNMLSPVS